MSMKRLFSFAVAGALLLAAPVQALAVKVVIDPGHGGSDPGAIGVNGIYETTVNHDIAHKLREVLLHKGYEVVMTKDDLKQYMSLADRVESTKTANADLFVSIHANAHPSSSIRGSMVLYYDKDYPQRRYPASPEMTRLTPESKRLAQHVLDQLVAAAGTANKGIVPSAVYVARMGNIPSVLVETAFLSNWEDAAMLADEQVRGKMAEGIAEGIEHYYPVVFPDLADHWARQAVIHIRDRGVVEGEHNYYHPERALTRAEFMTMMSRIFDVSSLMEHSPGTTVTDVTYGTEAEAKPITATYKDLGVGHWADSVMKQAIELRIIDGYQDQTVRPDRPISREEVAAIFDRLLKMSLDQKTGGEPFNTSPGAEIFDDVEPSRWSSDSIRRLYEAGYIDGMGEGKFAPARSMTRAEVAAVIDRYFQTVADSESRTARSE
jgi:N-acetylmuramoyl-L-alanine amidase